VPIIAHEKVIGSIRVYTSEHWDFSLDDVNFVQALAQIAGMAIDVSRLYQGHKESIEVLKRLREVQQIRTKRRTPYEGVPMSVPLEEVGRKAS
jgi:GAF domain-containing protein